MPRLFVLDAMNLAYRAYYAFIRRPLVNTRGENTSAIFGFANTALKIRREEKPDYWALAWDGPGKTFRHETFPQYKATRKPIPGDLLSQIPAIEDVAHALGLPVIEERGVEADDVMATLARRGEEAGFDVALVTSDKDLVQLVGERVRVLRPSGRGGGDEYAWIDRAAVESSWGLAPEQVRDVLALMGDLIDNVPGVPGVGEKTATELIKTFGSLDELYRRLDAVSRPALREKLTTHRDQAFLSRELVTVRTDLPLALSWDALRCGPIRRDALLALSSRYELKKLERIAHELGVPDGEAGAAAPGRSPERRGTAAEMRNPGVSLQEDAAAPEQALAAEPAPTPADLAFGPEPAETATAEAAPIGRSHAAAPQGALDLWSSPAAVTSTGSSLDALAAQLHEVRARALHGLAIVTFGAGPAPRTSGMVGLALAARDGTTCYLPIAHDAGPNFALAQIHEWLRPVLADPAVPKIGEDLKSDAHRLASAGLRWAGTAFDLHLGSFLCDPVRDHSLGALARDFLGVALAPFEAPERKRGQPRAGPGALAVADAELLGRSAASLLYPVADALRAQLESREQWRLYAQLEHPLIDVLFDMERAGVAIDLTTLGEMSARAATELERLQRELHELAGETINLESGPQVARVLFEKLGLKPMGKTPGGALSTRSDILEELAAAHPFPAKLLEFRMLAKLRSTYFEALPAVVDPADGRIHTWFHQAGAATGRLSSSDPNLQNIPIRTAQGRAIRRAFVAPPGRVLVGADYSQIELRVMAHLSEDPQLIAAFNSGEDVHVNTARRIFGVTDGLLDPELRSRAKVVNFGIMYGMGARSLSQQMGIGLGEAQEFIRNYFRVYARVREFLDATLEGARARGYVQTLLGRRRYLPALASTHAGERSFAERAAINMPIQGSAADLVKLAMVRAHRALKESVPSARLLLQVHDELLLESAIEDADAVSETVRAEMEGCYPLRVPLTVSLGRGATWFDAH
ncbi:MAG TPA: DNA polymerase I [Candidatus Limnocylindria bacterium]|nr:DNA polymerase I [Candidatus Limnocylindria bacterium]